MSKYNHRLSYKKRRARTIERSKPPVLRRDDMRRERSLKNAKRWFAAIVLLPVAAISLLTVVEMAFRASHAGGFWRSDEFFFFVLGSLAWGSVYWMGWRPVRSYVFAHEFTHLLVARLFGGKIYDWKVSAEGGYVETNKSNIWITLGPYLVPFYTLAVLAAFGIASLWMDLARWHPVSLVGVTAGFRFLWLLYALVGFTWWFHLTFTVKTVRAEQGDLTRNGEFFSLMLIFIANLALIVALFIAASPGASFADVGSAWISAARGCWSFATSLFG